MAIKLLIVDDSALMRRQLTQLFEAEGDFEIRLARNGREAVEENTRFEPDVITLDINMPEMDGLTALSHIMLARPVAVVMVSSLTEQGALATFEALTLGAVDYVGKPGGTISLSIDAIRTELVQKVRAASRARIKGKSRLGTSRASSLRDTPTPAREARPAPGKRPFVRRGIARRDGLVLIGVSTGGPSTLETILPSLPADFPYPVIVAQHMPASFTGAFARRIDQLCALSAIEVTGPVELRPGTIYIARGGADLVVAVRVGKLMAVPRPESSEYVWHPSVELLGKTVLEHCDPQRVIGVILTGMGNDGATSFTELHRRGARTIAESEESSVVFGMPRELIEHNGASVVLPAGRIAQQLANWAKQ